MKKVLIAAITLAMAGAASAAIPQLNYQCPMYRTLSGKRINNTV
ncbi:hypothetical protein [Aeromonas caviae]